MPSLFTSESLTLSVLQMLQLPPPELNSFKISSFSFLSHCFLPVRTQGEFFLFSSHDFFFFNIKFLIMDLWLIHFRCIYPCVIGFPYAVLFDNFVLFGFTIPVQYIIFWYFMALIFFENPISFCFHQWSLGWFNQWSLRPQILWAAMKRLLKAFVLKVLSLFSFDYVSYIFPQLLIQITMKFLGLDYMFVG